jgi:hypothetical protein
MPAPLAGTVSLTVIEFEVLGRLVMNASSR